MVALAKEYPKHHQRPFKFTDLEAITALLVNRHSERSACIYLGIKPQSYYNWKLRLKNTAKGEEYLARMRVAEFEARAKNIADAAQGKGPHKRADWRADYALLQMKFPEYFPDSSGSQANAPAPMVTVDALVAVVAKLTANQQPKQLADKAVEVPASVTTDQPAGKALEKLK